MTAIRILGICGSPIAQGMHLSSGQEHALTDLINHALVMQSIPVTGDIWESYIGAAGRTLNVRSGLKECREIFADQAIYRPVLTGLDGTAV